MSEPDSLMEAEREAAAARARLDATLASLRDRLRPQLLLEQTGDAARAALVNAGERAVDEARRRPGTLIVAGLGLAVFVLRRPIARLIGGLARRPTKPLRAHRVEPPYPGDRPSRRRPATPRKDQS